MKLTDTLIGNWVTEESRFTDFSQGKLTYCGKEPYQGRLSYCNDLRSEHVIVSMSASKQGFKHGRQIRIPAYEMMDEPFDYHDLWDEFIRDIYTYYHIGDM